MKLSTVKVKTPHGEGYLQEIDGINVNVNGVLHWTVVSDIEISETESGDSSKVLNRVTLQLLENNQDFINNLKKQGETNE